jgi:aminoglycoside phosphotransferase (APT) family kinase protein
VEVDAALVGALLRAQHPDLAGLPISELGSGWDNVLFRLGPDLLVRLPRRAASAHLLEHEQRSRSPSRTSAATTSSLPSGPTPSPRRSPTLRDPGEA